MAGYQIFLCGRPRTPKGVCKFCKKEIWSTVTLCDWKLTGPKAGQTCSVPMCLSCRKEVGPDKHLCPPHRRLWDKDPRNPANQETP